MGRQNLLEILWLEDGREHLRFSPCTLTEQLPSELLLSDPSAHKKRARQPRHLWVPIEFESLEVSRLTVLSAVLWMPSL